MKKLQLTKEKKNQFKELLKDIEGAKIIVIYRHVLPDFDALGTQMGLYTWIKENFPTKEVHYVGEGHRTFIPDLFPEPEHLDETFYEANDQKFLAICVDTATVKRMSEEQLKHAYKVDKLDHHPNVEPYGNLNIVYDELGAASELLASFCLTSPSKYTLSKLAARYFYIGVVGDTGRFQYQSTTPDTFDIASMLLRTGLDMTATYNAMYKSTFRTLNLLKFVLNNYHLTEKGTCYYIISDKDMKELDIDLNEGKLHINTFRNIEGCKICVSLTEDIKEGAGCYRVSLRSASTKINDIAAEFEGGGHDYAAGAILRSLDDLPKLISALDGAIK